MVTSPPIGPGWLLRRGGVGAGCRVLQQGCLPAAATAHAARRWPASSAFRRADTSGLTLKSAWISTGDCRGSTVLGSLSPPGRQLRWRSAAAVELRSEEFGRGDDGGGDNAQPPGDGGGGGGGGGAGGSADGRVAWILLPFAHIARGVRSRLRADPEFAFKLLVECTLDAAIIFMVNFVARGKRFVQELDFVLCQCLVSLLNDFALVYLLAPTLNKASPRPGSFRALTAHLPSHFFQAAAPGRPPFTVAHRFACLGVKAAQYGAMGFTMGVLGTGIVHGLTNLREWVDPEFEPPATMQSVLGTGLGWLYFMSVSSNIRYNTVNACEDVLYRSCPTVVGKLGSVLLRLSNNFFGAHSWVALASRLNLDRPRPRRQPQRHLPAPAAGVGGGGVCMEER